MLSAFLTLGRKSAAVSPSCIPKFSLVHAPMSLNDWFDDGTLRTANGPDHLRGGELTLKISGTHAGLASPPDPSGDRTTHGEKLATSLGSPLGYIGRQARGSQGKGCKQTSVYSSHVAGS